MSALAACIDAFEKSAWPDVVWRFSSLTGDGSPLLFAFSTSDDDLRFACEVAPPEAATSARVAAAAALAERLGARSVPSRELGAWQALQTAGPLRWGAWLGVRVAGESIRVKVYVEVPRDATPRVAAPDAVPIVRSSRLKMIGYDCAAGAREYYYRQPQMSEEESWEFKRFVGAAQWRQSVVDAFAAVCGLPERIALHWVNFGYSMADSQSGGTEFAMFLRGRTLPSRARVRQRFLESERALKSAPGAYADLLEGVAGERLPEHEMVSFIGREASATEMRAEISAASLEGFARS